MHKRLLQRLLQQQQVKAFAEKPKGKLCQTDRQTDRHPQADGRSDGQRGRQTVGLEHGAQIGANWLIYKSQNASTLPTD